MFCVQNIAACGFSLGLERILVVMGERHMFPPSLATTPADVMMATFDASGAAENIGKQIKYADSRGIPFVALLGENEIRDDTVTVKNLAAQTQDTYRQSDADAKLLEGLKQRG